MYIYAIKMSSIVTDKAMEVRNHFVYIAGLCVTFLSPVYYEVFEDES